mmetsp:Transcript_33296/g.70931  ORF Transcript_33296/g.70931 Transcript_33296/m.70931 type:complete len:204 (-) Transcript_33296:161-772(-)
MEAGTCRSDDEDAAVLQGRRRGQTTGTRRSNVTARLPQDSPSAESRYAPASAHLVVVDSPIHAPYTSDALPPQAAKTRFRDACPRSTQCGGTSDPRRRVRKWRRDTRPPALGARPSSRCRVLRELCPRPRSSIRIPTSTSIPSSVPSPSGRAATGTRCGSIETPPRGDGSGRSRKWAPTSPRGQAGRGGRASPRSRLRFGGSS